MTETETTTETVAQETWVFGGEREGAKGKKVIAWVDPETREEMLFAVKRGAGYSVGSEYELTIVRRTDDPRRVFWRGAAQYKGMSDDRSLRTELWAKHQAAHAHFDMEALERSDKRRSALDEVLAPACELIKKVPPNQRIAYIAYVMRKLFNTW